MINRKYVSININFIRKNKSGFTLIELTIVMIIVGLLLAGASTVITAQLRAKQVSDTKDRMAEIKDAVNDYVSANGDLPCPAGYEDNENNAGYGREAASAPGVDPDTIDCSALNDSSNIRVSGNGADKVVIGAVLVIALGLPFTHMYDGYRKRYTYAVTASAASGDPEDDGVAPGSGRITVQNNLGDDISTTSLYTIVSHGKDGRGAYTGAGVLVGGLACPDTANEKNTENCDGDSVFMDALYSEAEDTTNRFDDYIAFAEAITEGATLSNILVCNEKGMIFAPGSTNPVPDEDGCIQNILLDSIVLCNAKGLLFSASAVRSPDPVATADEDGCIVPQGGGASGSEPGPGCPAKQVRLRTICNDRRTRDGCAPPTFQTIGPADDLEIVRYSFSICDGDDCDVTNVTDQCRDGVLQ